MNDIIFIVKSNCENQALARSSYLPPLGVLSIANMLRVHGYNVHVLDFSVQNFETYEIDELIKQVEPLYIAFSVYTENVDQVFNMCRYFKKRHGNIPLVLGGPHPTVDTEYCKKKRFVDFILIGDGEQSALELAEAIRTNQKLIPFDEIQGLIYLSDKKVYEIAKAKKYVTNIDLLPIINRDYIEQAFYVSLSSIYSSRGCPAKCIYCAAPVMSGGKYRMRDIQNVFLETLYVVDTFVNHDQVFYCDDTFTVFNKRLDHFVELCEGSCVKFHWRCESRVDDMYRNSYILGKLKTSGCKRIQFGIESGNQSVLDNIRKGMELSEAYEVIDKTVKSGIGVATSFMFGHYCDTIETMDDTLKMMDKLKKTHGRMIDIAYAVNTPFPGTYQYHHMDELGIEMTAKTYAELDMVRPVIRTKNFDVDDLNDFNSRAMQIFHTGG